MIDVPWKDLASLISPSLLQLSTSVNSKMSALRSLTPRFPPVTRASVWGRWSNIIIICLTHQTGGLCCQHYSPWLQTLAWAAWQRWSPASQSRVWGAQWSPNSHHHSLPWPSTPEDSDINIMLCVISCCQSHLLASTGECCTSMSVPSPFQAGHVTHKAALLISWYCCPGIQSSCDDHMVTQGNTAGIPVINDKMINLEDNRG